MRLNVILFFSLLHIFVFSQDSLKRFAFKSLIITAQFGVHQQVDFTPKNNYYSYNASLHVGFFSGKKLLIQSGVEYVNFKYFIRSISDKFSSDENNRYVFDIFSLPIFLNSISTKKNILFGGGVLFDLVTHKTRTYDYKNHEPNSSPYTIFNIKEENTEIKPLRLNMCSKFDYIFRIKNIGIIAGARAYIPLYFNLFWNCRVVVNLGLAF